MDLNSASSTVKALSAMIASKDPLLSILFSSALNLSTNCSFLATNWLVRPQAFLSLKRSFSPALYDYFSKPVGCCLVLQCPVILSGSLHTGNAAGLT